MTDKPFTFICGDDEFLVLQQGRACFADAAKRVEDDMSLETVEGRANNYDEVAECINRFVSAVQTISMFGGHKVVWLKGATFLADTPTGRAQGTLDLLDHLKETLTRIDPGAVSVLITAQPVDKRRAFYKWCKKAADFKEISIGKDAISACASLVHSIVQESGGSIDRNALQLLIEKVSGNTRLAVEETNKLLTYVGREKVQITEDLVVDLVPNFGEADFFEAAEVFYTLNLAKTLEALKRHFFNNPNARPLLGSLQSRNRLLIQLRVLLDAGLLPQGGRISKADLSKAEKHFEKHFGDEGLKDRSCVFSQNPYYLGRLIQIAQRVSLKRLIDFQLAFVGAFSAMISRPNEPEEVCREMAVQCLG